MNKTDMKWLEGGIGGRVSAAEELARAESDYRLAIIILYDQPEESE